jgi:hypothetical protein
MAATSLVPATTFEPPENQPPDISEIPENEPPTRSQKFDVVKEVAKKFGLRALGQVVKRAVWLIPFVPYVESYWDEPKTFEELQSSVSDPKIGYNIHHIAEQTQAEKEGYGRDLIDGPDNLVRIPTLKHWEITGWYGRKNENFDFISPRDYLRGKSWEEKMTVGKNALVEHGVLKP